MKPGEASKELPSGQASAALQGIAFGGFNFNFNVAMSSGSIASSRCRFSSWRVDRRTWPRSALLTRVRDGEAKWAIIEKLGPMERGVYVQRRGLNASQAAAVIERFTVNSQLSEPLRVAHLIAGALTRGQPRRRLSLSDLRRPCHVPWHVAPGTQHVALQLSRRG